MSDLISKNLHSINDLCQDFGISYLGLFGSQARGDAREDSDVDILVEFKETPGLIEFIRTKQRLEQILNKKVDLVTRRGLSKHLSSYVNQDLQKIYG